MGKTKSENQKNKLTEFVALKKIKGNVKSKKHKNWKKLNLSSIDIKTDNFIKEKIDISFDDISNIKKESLKSKSPKKKKKHDNNSVFIDFETNNALKKIFGENEVCLDSNNSCSEEIVSIEKEHQNHEFVTTLDDIYNINNKKFKSKKAKKLKEHDKSLDSIDFISNNVIENGGESIDLNNYCSNKSVITQQKRKNHELLDMSLDVISHINNESFKPKKPKQKKKRDNNLISVDFATTNGEEKEGGVIGDNNSYSKEGVITEKEHQDQELLDMSLDVVSNINNDSFKSKSPKRKKKRDNNLVSIDFATTNGEEKEGGVIGDNNSYSKEGVITEKEHQDHELLDMSLDVVSNINNDSFKSKSPKRKKKRDNNLISVDFATTNGEENEGEAIGNNNSYSQECVITENEHQDQELLDISLNVVSNINNDSFKSKSPKKKKKRDNNLVSIDFATTNGEEKEGGVIGDNNSYSKEGVITEKEHQDHELLDMSLDVVSNINNDSFKSKSPKRKKKRDNNLISVDFATTNGEENEGEAIGNNNSYSQECVITENEHQDQELLDISLNVVSNINNDSFKSKSPKKKKKRDNNLVSIDFATTNGEEKEGGVIGDNNSYSKEGVITEKEHQDHELLDMSLDVVSNINNDSFKSKSPKRKKKRDNNLISVDFATTNGEENEGEAIGNNNSYSQGSVITQKKHQDQELLDISLNVVSNINNDSFKSKSPKKKKKRDNNLVSIDFATTNGEEKEGGVIGDNNSYSKEGVITEKEHQDHELLDMSLDVVSNINNDSFKSKSPKRKKKRGNNLVSIDFATTNGEEKEGGAIGVNNSYSKESVITEKEHQDHELLDISLDVVSNINNDSFKSKSPKKKKKSGINLVSIDFATTNGEENEGGAIGNNNSYSKECVITEKEHQDHELLDISLDVVSNINNDSFKSKSPKKKKKCDNNLVSIDFATTNGEEKEGGAIGDNNSYSKQTKKEMIHDNRLHSLDYTINNNTKRKRKLIKNIVFKLSGNKKLYNNLSNNQVKEEFTNIVKDIKSLQQNIITDDNSTIQNANKSYSKSTNISTNIENNSQKNSNADNSSVNHNVSQESIELEDFLSAVDLQINENLLTSTESKVELDILKLINLVINAKPSFKSHQNSHLIIKHFSSEIKKVLIKNKVNVSPSEMTLLKIIGEKMFEKCVEKLKNIEIIENLHIEVPSESKENKMHYLETTLSKYPRKTIIEKMKEHNFSIKLGVFNEEEDNKIKKYWLKFQQEYNISTVQPFIPNGLEIALPISKRLTFARYISSGLPNRLLYSVYQRFIVLFDKRLVDKSSFCKVADNLIMQVHNCVAIRKKYTVLNLLLNRTKHQLIKRLNSLKLQPSCKERIIWNIEKRQELFSSILLETNTKNWTDLKKLKIKKETWIKVAKNFSVPISDEKVRVQWKFLSTMLFCEQPIYYSTFKLTILKLLLQQNVKYWSDINWLEITNKWYPGANCKVISTIFTWWVHNKVPAEFRSDIRNALKYLSTQVDPDIVRLYQDRVNYFPRFTVTENNELIFKKDDF